MIQALMHQKIRGHGSWIALALAVLVAGGTIATWATPAESASRARVSLSPSIANPGESVTTTGANFPSRTTGKVFFGGKAVAAFKTTKSGKLTARWNVPANAKSGPVLAKTSSRRASAALEVRQPPPPPVEGQRWSDPATWDGDVPQAGGTVTVPADKTVVLDTSPPPLAGLEVYGTLVFEDRDLTLKSDYIMVHGKLQIGTEATPFESRARVVLTGADKTQNVMNMGAKVLGVMGGTLDVHGQDRPGWTKLNANANKGSTTLKLASAPNWRVGDEIVVSSTDYDFDQAEERKITAISGDTVTLDQPLKYDHWGTMQTFDGRPVDERAEVALLSRNVTIEGEEATSGDGFGGQVMVMGGSTARVEGAELTRMGQKNILRRYPIHFHMLGDAGANSYLKDSSLHETFNRCVTVHGTNKLSLTGNVCHDHIGHGFFFEDGAEVDNTVTGNLGLTTRRPAEGERLLPSDADPATFWITNPDNVLRDNVAAGSEGNGFWLAFPEHPTGLSTNANVWPRRTPLGEFSNNTAHSNNGDGLHTDNGPRPDNTTESSYYEPRIDPANGESRIVPVDFADFEAYKNRNRGAWIRGGNLSLTNATFADNAIGTTFAANEGLLRDSLLVGETSNKGNTEQWQVDNGEVALDGRSLPKFWEPDFPIRGYEFYDGRVGTENTTFVNFTSNAQRKASGLGYLLSDAFYIHPENHASGLKFVDANRVYNPNPDPGMDGDASKVFLDQDGSVTGAAGKYVTVNNPFLLDGSCAYKQEWNSHICGTEYVTIEASTDEGDPADVKPVILRRADGVEQRLMGCCDDSTSAETSVIPGETYEVLFNGGTPLRTSFVLKHVNGKSVVLNVPYPVEPKVTRWNCDLSGADPNNDWCGQGKKSGLRELKDYVGSGYYYDGAAKELYLKIITGPDYDYNELKVQPKAN